MRIRHFIKVAAFQKVILLGFYFLNLKKIRRIAEIMRNYLNKLELYALVPRTGLEPATHGAAIHRSATELPRWKNHVQFKDLK